MRNRRKTKVNTSTRKIAKQTATPKPTVRNKATVTFSKPIDGTMPAKKSRPRVNRIGRSSAVTVVSFPKEFLVEVHKMLRPGEKLVILSATEAKTVYI